MLLALAAVLLASAPAARPPAPDGPVTEVSTLVIYRATAPPKLVTSYPAADAAVPPGVLVLKLTFDQKMAPAGFDIAPLAAPPPGTESAPCLKTPRLLDDGRTFVLLCTLRAGRTYALAFNSAPSGGFANVTETRAAPAALTFTTTRADPVRSLDEAMKAQGLTRLEVPVQDTPNL